MGTLIQGVLKMSDLESSKDTLSATSLPESEDGQGHWNSQGGAQIDLFGPDLHPAKVFPLPEKEKAKTTSDTSGLSSLISSESANLQLCLENRLRRLSDMDGLMIYKKTLKKKDTPVGHVYCHLAVSAHRTKEIDSSSLPSSWPTPSTRDYKDTGDLDKSRWRKDGKERNDTVPRVAYGITAWPTPQAMDAARGPIRSLVNGQRIDKKGVRFGLSLVTAATLTEEISGQIPQSYTAETEKAVPSQLNPRFSLWLMGYPIEWAYCAERVTVLSRKPVQK